MTAHRAFKGANATKWTLARIRELSAQEIEQLRDNAERLNEPEVLEHCRSALESAGARRRALPRKAGKLPKGRRLIARSRAFEARGVFLEDARASWGGVRKADGRVVLALWADAIEVADGACRYLLWAPNVDGSRPWSDTPAGKERLRHCELAVELGGAEGLLVHGERLASHLPEEKAHAIHGVDAETVVAFQVERVGAAFWASWGKKADLAR